MKKLFAAGLSYKTAPVAMREKHAVAPADQVAAARHLMISRHLDEVVLLWTCNRVEIYGVADDPRERLPQMLECLANKRIDAEMGVYCHENGDAIRHLFSVASGMDSMVLGETEITNQVKLAYEQAREAGLTGKTLNRLFQKALETAKAVRTTTGIGKGAASVGSVAVQHAHKVLGRALSEKKTVIIGAGNMAEKCLRHLVKKGTAGIVVVNRSVEKAQELARQFGGTVRSFAERLQAIADADMIITSTGSPDIILEAADLAAVMALRPHRPLIVVDIAVPRDVDPAARTIPGLHLHDIDDLQGTVQESISHREGDLARCWEIIEQKAAELQERLARSSATSPEPADLSACELAVH